MDTGDDNSSSSSSHQFEKLIPKHIPNIKRPPQSRINTPRKLEFEHEKFTTRVNSKTLPAWAIEARKVGATKSAKKDNAVDGKYGMTEFLYRDLIRSNKIVEGMYEARFQFEARPIGTIGMSHDDSLVRSLSCDSKVEANMNIGNELWRVTDDDSVVVAAVVNDNEGGSNSALQIVPISKISNQLLDQSNIKKEDFKNFVPQIVDSAQGFDIAPLSKEGKKKAVFVVRVLLAPGTTIESLCEGLKHKVQHARHQSPNFREEFVPCEVRVESNSNGFLCGSVGCAIEVNCRVRTWAAAHHCLLPEKNKREENNNNNIFKWDLVRGGGQYSIISCWTLEEWKNNNNNNHLTSTKSSSSSSFKQPSITEYSLLIRGSECPMKSILEPLKKIRDQGFINYSSNQYFGMPMSNSIEFAQAFLQGRFTTCVMNHFLCLARTSRECTGAVYQLKRRLMTVFGGNGIDFHQQLLDNNNNNNNSASDRRNQNQSQLRRNLKFEWRTFVATLETSIDNAKHVCVVTKSNNADWDLHPLHKLLELARHIEQLDGDCAAALIDHQLLPDAVIQWHLKSLADLHFNTLASIRLRKFGTDKVAVGEVVCLDEDLLSRLDASGGGGGHTPSYCVPCSPSLTYDRNDVGSNNPLVQEFLKNNSNHNNNNISPSSPFKLIESISEAREYKPSSIILPKWGVVPDELTEEELLLAESKNTDKISNGSSSSFHDKFFHWVDPNHVEKNTFFPLPNAPGFDWETCATISKSLKIPPILSLPSSNVARFCPEISYRPLFAKPRWLFAHCWDNRSVSGNANVGLDALLMSAPDLHVFPTDVDGEGWRRMIALGSNPSASFFGNSKNNIFSDSSNRFAPMISPEKIRPAVRQKEVREILTAAVASKGITTALRIALPSGVALSSALREVFQLRTFDNRGVADRLTECVDVASRKTNSRLAQLDRRTRRRVENAEKSESMEF